MNQKSEAIQKYLNIYDELLKPQYNLEINTGTNEASLVLDGLTLMPQKEKEFLKEKLQILLILFDSLKEGAKINLFNNQNQNFTNYDESDEKNNNSNEEGNHDED